MNRNDAASAPRIVIIGSGIAGLSAAVSAAESAAEGTEIHIIERARPEEAGGLTRWTAAYLRLDEVDVAAEGFVEDIVSFSDGLSPRWYAERIVERIPETMGWVQSHGATFDRLPTYFINSSRKRLQPVGGGASLLEVLTPVAKKLGVQFHFETTATALQQGENGAVTGVVVEHAGVVRTLEADAVIIAAGGFEGDPAYLDENLGARDRPLVPIAPGAFFNRGEGIRMAIAAGAGKAGAWDDFHAEPVDPRAEHSEAIVMGFNYGILVDRDGHRFIDEGRSTIDETYEETARKIWNLPGSIAYFLTDQHYTDEVARGPEGILSRVEPITADSISELAEKIGIPVSELESTVVGYNAATTDAPFSWATPDGKGTEGIEPKKSNWAFPLDRGPFIAYPVVCAIVFTYGGLATDDHGRVIDSSGRAIDGLYAAGECTGLYHGKYPGGTSVLRGMIFGRLAGIHAAHRSSDVLAASH
jgi:tricarballylate dehydrogenase